MEKFVKLTSIHGDTETLIPRDAIKTISERTDGHPGCIVHHNQDDHLIAQGRQGWGLSGVMYVTESISEVEKILNFFMANESLKEKIKEDQLKEIERLSKIYTEKRNIVINLSHAQCCCDPADKIKQNSNYSRAIADSMSAKFTLDKAQEDFAKQ